MKYFNFSVTSPQFKANHIYRSWHSFASTASKLHFSAVCFYINAFYFLFTTSFLYSLHIFLLFLIAWFFSSLYYWPFRSFFKLLVFDKNYENQLFPDLFPLLLLFLLLLNLCSIPASWFFKMPQAVSHFLQYHIPLSIYPTFSLGFTLNFYSFSKNSTAAPLNKPRLRSL